MRHVTRNRPRYTLLPVLGVICLVSSRWTIWRISEQVAVITLSVSSKPFSVQFGLVAGGLSPWSPQITHNMGRGFAPRSVLMAQAYPAHYRDRTICIEVIYFFQFITWWAIPNLARKPDIRGGVLSPCRGMYDCYIICDAVLNHPCHQLRLCHHRHYHFLQQLCHYHQLHHYLRYTWPQRRTTFVADLYWWIHGCNFNRVSRYYEWCFYSFIQYNHTNFEKVIAERSL